MEDPNLSNNFKNDLRTILNNEVSEKINEEQYLNLIDLNRLKNKFKRIGEIGVIFIHINKAGGTSISSALYGGEQDENGLVRTHGHAKWWFYKAYFGAEKYNKFFKFAIVRNPYDRFVSIFHYLKKGGNNPSDKNFYEQYFDQDTTFEEFVNGTIKDNKLQNISHIKPQYPFIYNIKKELKINYIGRLEEINKSIEYVQNFCPHKIQLEKLNSSKHDHYTKYYNSSLQKIVSDYFRLDFEYLGYSKYFNT